MSLELKYIKSQQTREINSETSKPPGGSAVIDACPELVVLEEWWNG